MRGVFIERAYTALPASRNSLFPSAARANDSAFGVHTVGAPFAADAEVFLPRAIHFALKLSLRTTHGYRIER
jgi:hypothetical protein